MWQWVDYLHDQIPMGKKVLLLNLDETSICAFMGKTKGNIFIRKGVKQRMSKGHQRTYLTYIGVICDDVELQPLLPQFVVANGHPLAVRELHRLRESCSSNVRVLREKSAWMNTDLFPKMICLLAESLATYMKRSQSILIF